MIDFAINVLAGFFTALIGFYFGEHRQKQIDKNRFRALRRVTAEGLQRRVLHLTAMASQYVLTILRKDDLDNHKEREHAVTSAMDELEDFAARGTSHFGSDAAEQLGNIIQAATDCAKTARTVKMVAKGRAALPIHEPLFSSVSELKLLTQLTGVETGIVVKDLAEFLRVYGLLFGASIALTRSFSKTYTPRFWDLDLSQTVIDRTIDDMEGLITK